jgi:DNA-binding transcriptional MocR family regulator
VDFDDLLKQGLSQVLMRADAELLMTYHLGGGSDSDRKAEPMAAADVWPLDARQVVVCPGAQAAIAALILALTEPGDVILAEPASYPGLRAAATQFGASLWKRTARDGARDAGAGVPPAPARAGLPQSHLQNPTAITMANAGAGDRQHRQALPCTHRRGRPYWLLADAPPPPIASWPRSRCTTSPPCRNA